MRSRESWIIIVFLVLATGYLAYNHRTWVVTRAWHLRHGDSVRLDPYTVPVPSDWLPIGEPQGLFMLRTLKPNPRVPTPTTVSVWVSRANTGDLAFWKSFEQESLKKHGLRSVEERTLDLKGETLVCIGGYQFRDAIAPKIGQLNNVKSFVCTSSGSLGVMFNADPSEVDDIFALLSQVHR